MNKTVKWFIVAEAVLVLVVVLNRNETGFGLGLSALMLAVGLPFALIIQLFIDKKTAMRFKDSSGSVDPNWGLKMKVIGVAAFIVLCIIITQIYY